MVDIASGTRFCYFYPHTIKPLPDTNKRRGPLLLFAGLNLQQQINDIPIRMVNMRFLVIQLCGYFESSRINPTLELSMPKLEKLKLVDVAFGKVKLNKELQTLVEELLMQNISNKCDLTVESLLLKSLFTYYYGPADDDEWVHGVISTDKHLQSFDSYKLCIYPKPNFSGKCFAIHPSSSFILHHVELLQSVSVYASNLTVLSLQGCYSLIEGELTIMVTHLNFARQPGHKSDSDFTVYTINASFLWEQPLSVDNAESLTGEVSDKGDDKGSSR